MANKNFLVYKICTTNETAFYVSVFLFSSFPIGSFRGEIWAPNLLVVYFLFISKQPIWRVQIKKTPTFIMYPRKFWVAIGTLPYLLGRDWWFGQNLPA